MNKLNFDILTNCSTDTFKLKAFNEYCIHRQQSYQKVIQALTIAVNSIPEDTEIWNATECVTDALVATKLNGDSQVLLSGGYIKLTDLLFQCLSSMKVDNPDLTSLISEKKITLKNATGSDVAHVSFSDVSEDLIANLHSATALIAANKAVLADNVSDALTIYRDEIQTYFQNGYADVSNTTAYLKMLIENAHGSIATYMSSLAEVMNVQAMAADNSTAVPSEDTLYAYTGSTPLGCLGSSIKTMGDMVGAVVNAGAKVLAAILNGVFTVTKSIFSTVGRSIYQTLIDPMDVTFNADGDDFTIDGFCWEMREEYKRMHIPEGYTSATFKSILSDFVGNWIMMDFFWGTVLFRFYELRDENSYLYSNYELKFKPKAVHPSIINDLLENVSLTEASNLHSFQFRKNWIIDNPSQAADFAQWASKFSIAPPEYCSPEDSELTVLKGFLAGFGLMNLTLASSAYLNGLYNFNGALCQIVNDDNFLSMIGGKVRNCDFVTIASGYYYNLTTDGSLDWNKNVQSLTFSGSSQTVKQLFVDTNMLQGMGAALSQIIGLHAVDEYERPLEYTFIPFCNGTNNFPTSKWRISTDKENATAFERFATAAIVVTVVAIVAITAIVFAKRAANVFTRKALERKSVIDQKLWNGEKITAKEWRQYKRASKKLSATTLLTSGVQGNTNSQILQSDATRTSDAISLYDIYTLIKAPSEETV